MALINVILSGGVGSRLWPLSRKSRPKQYIPLFDGHTLFEMCVQRNKDFSDAIAVIGNIDNYELSRRDLNAAGVDNYIEVIEAVPRNTAASIAFAALTVNPDDILLVTPSDHIIDGQKAYNESVATAADMAGQGFIVTFGSVPSRAETGYGYIEHDDHQNVICFREKPSKEKAEEYVQSGRYLWNSGMFAFKASVYLEELEKFAPEVLNAAKKTMEKTTDGFLPLEESLTIPAISVDYAVMEHSQKIKVVPFNFNWSDLGSFDALWDYLDEQNTDPVKDHNLVLGSAKHVEFIGLENLILVETDDAVLIMPRNLSQEVKKVYERLEIEKPELLK
jgi:mannose-1-phosphate guanylyltransferase